MAQRPVGAGAQGGTGADEPKRGLFLQRVLEVSTPRVCQPLRMGGKAVNEGIGKRRHLGIFFFFFSART